MLVELLRREKDLNIKPDPYLDALMKVPTEVREVRKKFDNYTNVILFIGIGYERTQGECGYRLHFKGLRT